MQRALAGMRFFAALLDLLLITGGGLIIGFGATFLIHLIFPSSIALIYTFWRGWTVIILILFLLKDAVESPGKQIFSLRVTTAREGEAITPVRSIVRNLPLIIPLINLYEIYLCFNGTRLGDKIARTRVVEA